MEYLTFDDVPSTAEFEELTLLAMREGHTNSDEMRLAIAEKLNLVVNHRPPMPWNSTPSGTFKNRHAFALLNLQDHKGRHGVVIFKKASREYAFTAAALSVPETLAANYLEGANRNVRESTRERNTAARNKCLSHYGTQCSACDMSFGERYGNHMAGFIHVHHLSPLSSATEERLVDPISDLRPVCPNCHAAIHSKDPMLTIEELRKLLQTQ